MQSLTLDRTKRKLNKRVLTTRAEREYAKQLKAVGRQVGRLIGAYPPGDISQVSELEGMLRRYAEALMPWAERTAAKMIEEVNKRDLDMWRSVGLELKAGLHNEISTSTTGQAMRDLLAEQVELIKSLPIEAGKRVHELTLKGIEDGTRAKEIAKEILRSGEVTENRAMLIARTEVSRTAANLTEARAQQVGSTTYIWRTSADGDVRADHKLLNGQAFRWDQPPIADQRTGARANPGCIYNCRCYAEPVIPD